LSDGIYTGRQARRGELPRHLPYDPIEAKRLLETAAWKDNDGDGIRERDGQTLHFTALVISSFENYERIAVQIQDQLHQVGVRMDIQVGEMAVVLKKMESGEFEAVFCPIRFSLFLQRQFSFGYQELGYSNVEVIKLIDRLVTTAAPNAADDIYQQLSEIFLTDLPVTFLFPAGATCIVHRRVKGLISPWRADPVAHMEHLWLEDDG
jgi:peptide/nickel transport system substrate-binding protein